MACGACMALAGAEFLPAAEVFDPAELAAGCVVELEHTASKEEACRIAKDHLREDPHYYTKLCSLFPGENGCGLLPKKRDYTPVIIGGLALLALYFIFVD